MSRTYQDLNAVDNVDLERYMGLWYSVYEIPTHYGFWIFGYESTECINSTAYYTLNTDGTVHVLNRCIRNGEPISIEGTAKVKEGGKLEVSFFPLIWSDYQIIGLDANYQWAVVGTPSRNGLWYLSRNPTIEPSTKEAMDTISASNGYDLSNLGLVERG